MTSHGRTGGAKGEVNDPIDAPSINKRDERRTGSGGGGGADRETLAPPWRGAQKRRKSTLRAPLRTLTDSNKGAGGGTCPGAPPRPPVIDIARGLNRQAPAGLIKTPAMKERSPEMQNRPRD